MFVSKISFLTLFLGHQLDGQRSNSQKKRLYFFVFCSNEKEIGTSFGRVQNKHPHLTSLALVSITRKYFAKQTCPFLCLLRQRQRKRHTFLMSPKQASSHYFFFIDLNDKENNSQKQRLCFLVFCANDKEMCTP